MASLEELDNTLPAHFTLSNKKLLLIARVREEAVFFYDQLGPTTTVVLLAEPMCYALKRVFLEFVTDTGATVIDLREQESFDQNYKISDRSVKIINTLIRDNDYDQIITHPRYSVKNDPQNRALFDLVSVLLLNYGLHNHYTYNKIGINGSPMLPRKVKDDIFRLYCTIIKEGEILDKKMYQNYLNISSNISGIRRVLSSEAYPHLNKRPNKAEP
jgi:hypothetical protein